MGGERVDRLLTRHACVMLLFGDYFNRVWIG